MDRMRDAHIYAADDNDAKFAEFRKPMLSQRYRQVPLPGARHDYRGFDKQIAEAVIAWLREQEPRSSVRTKGRARRPA